MLDCSQCKQKIKPSSYVVKTYTHSGACPGAGERAVHQLIFCSQRCENQRNSHGNCRYCGIQLIRPVLDPKSLRALKPGLFVESPVEDAPLSLQIKNGRPAAEGTFDYCKQRARHPSLFANGPKLPGGCWPRSATVDAEHSRITQISTLTCKDKYCFKLTRARKCAWEHMKSCFRWSSCGYWQRDSATADCWDRCTCRLPGSDDHECMNAYLCFTLCGIFVTTLGLVYYCEVQAASVGAELITTQPSGLVL